MQIKFQLLNKDATIPTCASFGSAGYDLYACLGKNEIFINSNERILIQTGIAIEIPHGYFGMVCSRSGLAKKFGITVLNAPGIIDSDYRGEIGVILHNGGNVPALIKNNQRIAQIIIVPYLQTEWIQTEFLSETSRGTGGFGSTGI